jgi:hypothetical protein
VGYDISSNSQKISDRSQTAYSDRVSAMAIHPKVRGLKVGVRGVDGLASKARTSLPRVAISLLRLYFDSNRTHAMVDRDN